VAGGRVASAKYPQPSRRFAQSQQRFTQVREIRAPPPFAFTLKLGRNTFASRPSSGSGRHGGLRPPLGVRVTDTGVALQSHNRRPGKAPGGGSNWCFWCAPKTERSCVTVLGIISPNGLLLSFVAGVEAWWSAGPLGSPAGLRSLRPCPGRAVGSAAGRPKQCVASYA